MNRYEQENPYGTNNDGCGPFFIALLLVLMFVVVGMGMDALIKSCFRVSILEQVGK